MKVLSLFSGIGAFEKALKNMNIPFELVGFSEIDKYAVKSYCAIHDVSEELNLGDITKIDEKALPKDIDLITYGFPCQDISLSGKQKGLFNEDGTQTRSGLFFEALRIIEKTQPRVAIAENVKNLVGKKFKEQFQIVLDSLEQAGYNNYWKVLNAKDFGIPQNRERVFIVSIRKDIDTGVFEFPEGYELKLRLKDLLEDEVDEKFYLSNRGIDGIINALTDGRGHKPNILSKDREYAPTIDTRVGDQTHRSPYVEEQPILGGNTEPKVLVREATIKGYAEAVVGDSINFEQPNSKTRRGRVGKQVAQTLTTSPQQGVVIEVATATAMRGRYNENGDVEQRIEVSDRDYANAITTVQKDSMVHSNSRIRKLTPKECWRLMGFDDEDFEKAEAVNSNTQLYKQAGNSIVVDVLEALLKELIEILGLKEGEEMIYRYEDPARDAEAYYCDNEPKSIGNCECCSDVICEGEKYYDIEGELIHEDCLRDWAEKYKRTA